MVEPNADIWRAIKDIRDRLTIVERSLEDSEMAAAVSAGVKSAMRGKVLLPMATVPKVLAALVAAVALAGGIKGLIG